VVPIAAKSDVSVYSRAIGEPTSHSGNIRLRTASRKVQMGITEKEVVDALRAAQNRTAVKGDKGEYVQSLVCIRCLVQRSVRIDARNGDRLGGGGYDYRNALGYLLKGGGPLTAEERSELRLAEVQGHLSRRRRRRAG
jgi:hypothetical protein